MYIAQLRLKGFKSFGGEHELSLSPGLTCVVGPNGSGKSNLLDAMRWVLGEGAPSDLRITRQTDLLFQGSSSFPPGSEAEVALKLLSGKESCMIKRRVDRDGIASLHANGARLRLQDLDQVKRDWGLEGIRFAFIGQGEIAEIIQQKPLQRRMLLEGLFGIDLYRKKREEAVDRLEKAEEELLRLSTLLSELSARREEIAPMVEKADKARGILETLETLRRLFYWLRRGREEAGIEALVKRRGLLEFEQATHAFWSGGWKREKEMLGESVARIQAELETCQDQHGRVQREMQESIRQAASLASALRSGKERWESTRIERQRRSAALFSLEKEEETQKALADKLEAELAEKREAQCLAREERLRRQEDIDRKRKEILALSRRRAGQEAEIESLKARLGGLGRNFAGMQEELKNLSCESLRIENSLADAAKALEEADKFCTVAVETHSAAFAEAQKTASDLARLRKHVGALLSELENLNQKIDGQVLPRPVQFLVAAAKLGRLEVSLVPVIDAFECPSRLEKAIEAYLGGRQFWLFVGNLEGARLCIERLREAGAGRATFLPLERCRGNRPDLRPDVSKEAGILGWAIDSLEIGQTWEKGVRHLLGDLLLAEDYPSAAGFVRKRPTVAVATLEGDVFTPGGSVSGGSQKGGPGGIEMRRRRKELEASLESLQGETVRLQSLLAECEKREIETSGEKERAFSGLRKAEEEALSLKGGKDRLEREALRLQEARGKALESLSATGKSLLASVTGAREAAVLLGSIEPPREESSSLDVKASSLNTEVLVAEERQKGVLDLLQRILKDKRETSESLRATDMEIDRLEKEHERITKELGCLGRKYLLLWEEKAKLATAGCTLSSGVARYRKDLVRVVAREGRAQEASKRCSSRLAELDGEIAEAENGLAELLGEWEEKFPYPGKGQAGDGDLEEVKRSIRHRERSLREIGAVDMGVLSEDMSLRERTTFLSEQCSDVSDGIRSLQGFISDTDRQASRIFGLAMEGIDRRFDILFRRLFGGGEAHLEMEGNGQEVWKAGVDVSARPPGKRPQGLTQLSGGEQSLTAIALLFAAMEEARVPIAILDEADAALDEVNLRRYVDLAAEYARDLQIIAMTHRRTTMEKADVLYGVTLSEPGLSQIVGVRMEDWA